MITATVQAVTEDNWRDVIALTVHPEQERFVPSVAISLAKAYIKPDGEHYDPFVIYADGKMVGFYSFNYKPQRMTRCYLAGFLIENNHQGRGYGKAALSHFLRFVQTQYPECEAIYLTVHPHNIVATQLYQNFGFQKTGGIIDGEDARGLTLPWPTR